MGNNDIEKDKTNDIIDNIDDTTDNADYIIDNIDNIILNIGDYLAPICFKTAMVISIVS